MSETGGGQLQREGDPGCEAKVPVPDARALEGRGLREGLREVSLGAKTWREHVIHGSFGISGGALAPEGCNTGGTLDLRRPIRAKLEVAIPGCPAMAREQLQLIGRQRGECRPQAGPHTMAGRQLQNVGRVHH